MIPWLLLATLPGLTGLFVGVNLLTWARASGSPQLRRPRISALIPARNEEATIERCVRALAANGDDVYEIIVYEDRSEDSTRAILNTLQEEFPHLRVVDGVPLPPGWVGKPHACHHLSRAARGDLWVYVDADTTVRPDAMARLASLYERFPSAGVISLVPNQLMGSPAEKLLMPLLHLTYMAWLPLQWVYWFQNTWMVAANGQMMSVTPAAYERFGGFSAIRQEMVDDMAFARLAKKRGVRVLLADGQHAVDCRMYDNGAELWNGFSKNLYEGIGGNPLSLLVMITMQIGAFVAPFAVLPFALTTSPELLAPALVGSALNLIARGAMAVRYGHKWWAVALHPFAVLGMIAIAINSWWWARNGRITWRGRVYEAKKERALNPAKEVARG